MRGVARRGVSAVLCVIALVAGAGGDEDEPRTTNPTARTVADVVDGRVSPGEEVRLAARAYPVGEAGFVLVGDGAAIFVDVAETEALKIEGGETVQVEGVVQRQDDGTSIQIESALEGDDPHGSQQPVDRQALQRAPIGQGKPYIEGFGLHREGNDQRR